MVMEGDTFTAYTDRKTAREAMGTVCPDMENYADRDNDTTTLPFISEGTEITTAPVGENDDSYADFKNTAYAVSLLEDSKLMPGETGSEIIAVMIYMPEGVGNEANHKPGAEYKPQIKFGLNLEAAQLVSEADSFDELYDASAQYADGSAVGITKPGYVPPADSTPTSIKTFDELKYYIENTSDLDRQSDGYVSLSVVDAIDFSSVPEGTTIKVNDKIYLYMSQDEYGFANNADGKVTFDISEGNELYFGNNSNTLGVLKFTGQGEAKVGGTQDGYDEWTEVVASDSVKLTLWTTKMDKLTVNGDATVVLEGGMINPWSVNRSDPVLVINGGNVTIRNDTIYGKSAHVTGETDLNAGTLSIEDGYFDAIDVAAGATLNISGGTFKTKFTVAEGVDTDDVNITGGKFWNDDFYATDADGNPVFTLAEYVEAGYVAQQIDVDEEAPNDHGKWQVVSVTP